VQLVQPTLVQTIDNCELTLNFSLLVNQSFLNEIRSFDTVVECQKGYIKKCATPLQKELFDFFLESFTKTVEEFCGNPETKQSK